MVIPRPSLTVREARPYLPGLLLTATVTAAAYALSTLPGTGVLGALGALGMALLLGMAWRAVLPMPANATPGLHLASRGLLRIGIVLLGVRLNFAYLAQSGWQLLVLDALVILLGLTVIPVLGRKLGVPRALSWSVAVGTSICGASAIAAAAPVVKASDRDVGLAVAVVSVLGTVGVVAFVLAAPVLSWTAERYGLVTGATLHEVAQVLAAGAAGGERALDYAALAKLTRVALLAPTLLLLSALVFRARGAGECRPPLVPWFLAGFLIVGTLNSLGWVPAPAASVMQTGSLLLMAAAMSAIGLGVNPRGLVSAGRPTILLGAAGFALLVVTAVCFAALFVP